MLDRLKQIPARLLEIWKNWTRNQKIIIVSAVVVFIAAVIVIAYVLSRPTYQELTKCEDYSEMNTVTTLLTDNGYTYQINNMTVNVKKQDLTNAKMLIASNDIKHQDIHLMMHLTVVLLRRKLTRIKICKVSGNKICNGYSIS